MSLLIEEYRSQKPEARRKDKLSVSDKQINKRNRTLEINKKHISRVF
jgi:hypothetical protein